MAGAKYFYGAVGRLTQLDIRGMSRTYGLRHQLASEKCQRDVCIQMRRPEEQFHSFLDSAPIVCWHRVPPNRCSFFDSSNITVFASLLH